MIHILLCTDNNYTMPCGVTMLSISLNNISKDICFHIFIENVDEIDRKKLLDSLQSELHSIQFYEVDSNILNNLPISTRFRKSIYYRLLLDNILDKSIERILYLDSDIIVRDSIEALWNENIDEYVLGAVLDQSCDDIRNFNRTKLPYLSDYFNSGVLLININKWRAFNIGKRCIKYISQNPESCLYPDQDALNVITSNSHKILPLCFNVQAFMFYRECEILARESYVKDMVAASKFPIIIHYTNACKPWNTKCDHPMVAEFLKYKALTPWKNIPLKRTRGNRIIETAHWIQELLTKVGLSKPIEKYTLYRDM